MKVGDYVRTKDYGFIKVKSFYYNEDLIHILDENNNEYDFSKELVNNFKPSPNIIDLIEVGDYVNGYLVTTGNQGVGSIYIDLREDLGGRTKLYEQDIKSIVTKEQFESMEYKIGDKE